MFGVSVKRPRLSCSVIPVFGLSISLCEKSWGNNMKEKARVKVFTFSIFAYDCLVEFMMYRVNLALL